MANVVSIIVRAFDETKAGLTTPIKNITDLRAAVGKLQPALLAVGTTVATFYASVGKDFINLADDMGKLSEKTGMSTESLSELKYIAEENNVAFGELKTNLKEFAKSIDEAATKGGANSPFARLGIDVRNADGALKSSRDLMREVSDRFSQYEDGATKSALASQLFGKAGQGMIPVLNQGAAGLDEAAKRAGIFSTIIGADTARSSDGLNDRLAELWQLLKKGVTDTFVKLIPILEQVAEALVEFARESEGFSTIWRVLEGVVRVGAATVYSAAKAFQYLGIAIGSTAAAAGEAMSGNFKGATAILEEAGGRMQNIATDLWETLSGQKTAKLKVETQQTGGKGKLDEEENQKRVNELVGEYQRKREAVGARKLDLIEREFQAELDKIDKLGLVEKDKDRVVAAAAQFFDDKRQVQERENEQERLKVSGELIKMSMNGAQAIQFAEQQAHLERLNQIEELEIAEDRKLALKEAAQIAYQDRLTELEATGALARADLDAAFQEGNLARYQEFLASGQAAFLADLEARQGFLALHYQLVQAQAVSFASVITTLGQAAFQGMSNALAGLITGAMTLGEAAKAMGQAMVNAIAQYIAQRVAAFVIEKTLMAAGLAAMGAQVAAGIGAAAALAAAWAPAATAASIASFGGAAAAGGPAVLAAMIANTAAAKSLALVGGVAHGGMDYVPGEATYLLQQGERVVQPSANRDLTEFLEARGSGGGSNGPVQVTLMLDRWTLGKALFDMGNSGELTLPTRAVV